MSQPPILTKADRAFEALVGYERPRRVLALCEEIKAAVAARAAEYMAQQPIYMRSQHPSFRQAARCAEILTGHPAEEIELVGFEPSERRGRIDLSVITRDRRRHDKVGLELEALAGAWLDARDY